MSDLEGVSNYLMQQATQTGDAPTMRNTKGLTGHQFRKGQGTKDGAADARPGGKTHAQTIAKGTGKPATKAAVAKAMKKR